MGERTMIIEPPILVMLGVLDWCNCLVGLQLTDAFTRRPNIPGARVESDLAEGRFQ
jgi:hypothetical protein